MNKIITVFAAEKSRRTREKFSKFLVQKKMCATCIYRPDSPLDLKALEDQVCDPFIGFRAHRICHDSPDGVEICCRGFWEAHKDEFQAGQIAQRLGLVTLVSATAQPDTKPIAKKRRKRTPSEPEVVSEAYYSEEKLKKAILVARNAGRTEFTFGDVCRLISKSDRLSVSIYKQQKFALKE